MKNKEKNKLILSIVIVLLIIVLVAGSTFAYWSWQSDESDKTLVSVTVGGGSLTIKGKTSSVAAMNLQPTNLCNGEATLSNTVVVTAKNDTTTNMTVELILKAALAEYSSLNNNLCSSSGNKDCIKWAIVDNSTSNTCSTTNIKGTFINVTENTDIETGITYTVPANSTIAKEYTVYMWLDSEYKFTNIGDTITDPLQTNVVTLTWSENSRMYQS